jgi:hypothetical protein
VPLVNDDAPAIGEDEESAAPRHLLVDAREAKGVVAGDNNAQYNIFLSHPKPSVPPPSRIWSLGPRTRSFVGRETELEQVSDRLTDARIDPAVVVVRGPGGIGKSQIAVEYAYRYADRYDLVWWLPAEDPVVVKERLATLGDRMGITAGTDPRGPIATILEELAQRDRWLLILDNVDSRRLAHSLIPPGGGGHVVITSREPEWEGFASHVSVGRLSAQQSIELLRKRLPRLSMMAGKQLARGVDYLPLALVQASSTIAETKIAVKDYLGLLESEAGQVLVEGTPEDYPLSLAASWNLAMDTLAAQAPLAVELLEILVRFAPEPIPLSMLSHGSKAATSPTSNALAFHRAIGAIRTFGLAQVDDHTLTVHRLGRLITRDRIPPARMKEVHASAVHMALASHPGTPRNPDHWPAYSRLLPHVQALGLADSELPAVRRLLLDAIDYIARRGDTRTAATLAEAAHEALKARFGADEHTTLLAAHLWANCLHWLGDHMASWRLRAETLRLYENTLGAEHPDAMTTATNLATDSFHLGRYEDGRRINEETLARRRRILGIDDSETLRSASNLVTDLIHAGELALASSLNADTLERRRRTLGPNHPDSLTSASKMAIVRFYLGDYEGARALDSETLGRRKRVLGSNHPDTLSSASNLTADLLELGERDAARAIGEDTLARRKKVLGVDHPDWCTSAMYLATILFRSGEAESARALDIDVRDRRCRLLGEDHPDTLISAANVAVGLFHSGDLSGACTLNEDVLQRRRRLLGDDHPDTLVSAANVAVGLFHSGDLSAACTLNEDVLQRRRRLLGDDHPDTLITTVNLAVCLLHAGERDRARDCCHRVLNTLNHAGQAGTSIAGTGMGDAFGLVQRALRELDGALPRLRPLMTRHRGGAYSPCP